MTSKRAYSFLDQLCLQAEQGLRLLSGARTPENRPNPAQNLSDPPMTDAQRTHTASLMRVNHTGEVCAQALYFGQALLARTPALRAHLHHAAIEEGDHLIWCEERIHELGEHTSVLNPAFYTFSVLIGMFAACLGDKISLGFIAATEAQVEEHLQSHLDQLPQDDARTHAILIQMQKDEIEHGSQALAAGGKTLPLPIQDCMRQVAKIMTHLSYRF